MARPSACGGSLLPLLLLLAVLRLAVAAQGSTDAATQSVPLYGNWCGPHHGSGKPIDAIDKCCQSHDFCYDKAGYFACACDKQIVGCLKPLNLAKGTEVMRSFRDVAIAYFKNTLCKKGGIWQWARAMG